MTQNMLMTRTPLILVIADGGWRVDRIIEYVLVHHSSTCRSGEAMVDIACYVLLLSPLPITGFVTGFFNLSCLSVPATSVWSSYIETAYEAVIHTSLPYCRIVDLTARVS